LRVENWSVLNHSRKTADYCAVSALYMAGVVHNVTSYWGKRTSQSAFHSKR